MLQSVGSDGKTPANVPSAYLGVDTVSIVATDDDAAQSKATFTLTTDESNDAITAINLYDVATMRTAARTATRTCSTGSSVDENDTARKWCSARSRWTTSTMPATRTASTQVTVNNPAFKAPTSRWKRTTPAICG